MTFFPKIEIPPSTGPRYEIPIFEFAMPIFSKKEIELLRNTRPVSKTVMRYELRLWLPKRLRAHPEKDRPRDHNK